MKKIFVILFLSSFLFSCSVSVENKKDVLKIDKEDFKILFVPVKYRNSVDLRKLAYDQNSNLKFGKAEDINFINNHLKSLRDSGLLKKDMYIFSFDLYNRHLHPTTSNFMLTREDSLHPFDSKKLKSYFILREY